MANETKTQGTLKVLAARQQVERAAIAADGSVNVGHDKAQLQSVDVVDVDLLLTFADGSYVVIANGALDAISGTAHDVTFTDSHAALGDLFKQVGITAPAKAGSLRLVSEGVDAAPPPSDESAPDQPAPAVELPTPPAPMVKVGAGSSAGTGKGPGNGNGTGISEANGEVQEQVQAVKIAEPPYYKSGTLQQAVEVAPINLFDSLSNPPTVSATLFTSSSFKLTGATGTPDGAWIAPPATLRSDVNYSTDRAVYDEQLGIRSSPGAQASRATITGTDSADSIIHNSAFSTTESQWVMNLHLDTANFDTISKIDIRVNAAYADIPGFDIQGVGVTHVAGTNQWLVDPAAVANLLTQGLNLNIVYTISDDAAYLASAATVVASSITVTGTHTENGTTVTPEVTTSFQFISTNAETQADYTVPVTDPIYGTTMMVLPRSGVGYDIYAGAGDDVVHAGAGADMVKGEAGNDTLDGGSGNDLLNGGLGADTLVGGSGIDTATYIDAATGITAALDASLAGQAGTESYGDTFADIENLTGSAYADTLIGNSGINALVGGDGDDVLEGRGGADSLAGGNGIDSASYAQSVNAVSVSLLTGTGTGATTSESFGDTLSNIENLTGSAYGDTLEGDANANVLDGGAGNDTLTGGAGGDTLIGGDGIDSASYAASTSGLTVALTAGLVTQTGDAEGDTFSNVENLIGTAFNDTLVGDLSANTLNGGSGDDLLEGLSGADSLQGGTGNDTASYAHAGAAVSASLADASTNTGADAAGDSYSDIENLAGSDYNDTLTGNSSANTLTGNAGNDVLEGLGGADLIDGGSGSNTASYAHAAVIAGPGGTLLGVTASLAAPGTNTGDAQGDRYLNIQNLLGSDYNDTLTGNAAANTLTGGDGNDLLDGQGGADALIGGSGIDTASYASAATAIVASLADASTNTGSDALGDTYNSIENLSGGIYNDTLIGDGSSNTLSGNSGDDVLEGLAGADVLAGGSGNNTVSYAHSGQASYAAATSALSSGVAASLTTSFLQGDAFSQSGDAQGDSYSAIANMVGSDYADTLIGDAAANTLAGGAGDDVLEGLGGADVLDGGLGNNTASYNHAAAQAGGVGVLASLDAAYGVNSGEAAGDRYLNIGNLVGSTYDDTLIGNDADNTLSGGSGDDLLEGQDGADTLDGGAGNDSASYANASTAVRASLASASANTGAAAGDHYTSIENLVGSAYDDTLIGNSGVNILSGGAGNDTLDGGAGSSNGDTLIGGDGTDSATYAAAGAAVTASLTSSFSAGAAVVQSGDATGDTFSSIENLTGSAYADTLIGDAGVNALSGGDGDDILEGMDGADTLDGGAGSNTASYAHSTGAVLASLDNPAANSGNAATGDRYIGIDNLAGSDFNDTLVGNASANRLTGGLGNDLLEGLAGADTLDGGAGSDTASYAHATAAVAASLLDPSSNTGVDAEGDSYSSIENLTGSDYNDTLTGNSSANTLVGGAGDDLLEGLAGADTLDGGAGNNTASYTHAAVIVGAGGALLGVTASLSAPGSNTGDAQGDSYSNIQNLLGSDYNDTLTGNAGANTLTGGLGNNLLEGLAGADTLIGGSGIDTASYASAATGIVASLAASTTNTGTDAQGDSYSLIDNLTGSAFADTLIGDGASNTLSGGTGDDVLEGMAGADTLIGGSGINTVSFAHSGLSSYALGTATTTVGIGVAASLTSTFLQGGSFLQSGDAQGDSYSGIANMLGSDYADTLIGDAAANVINGGTGDDVLEGMGGADALDGGDTVAGNNTASYQHAAAQAGGVGVLASLDSRYGVNTGDATGDSYTNISNLSGSVYNDTLIGNINNNTLSGGDGNDVLEGLGGADTLIGGAGNNTASYAHAGVGGVTASLTMPLNNTSDAAGDSYQQIQNLTGSAFDDTLTGDTESNVLDGGSGDDLLDGGAGAKGDSLIGGSGTDTVTYANALTVGVTATLTSAFTAGAAVIETGDATGDTFSGVENLTGSAFADTLIGDDQDNVLSGGAGNNVLEGMAGNDQLIGGTGNDTASYAHATGEVVASLSGTLFANGATVVIKGDAVGDTYTSIENLSGGSFGDTLIGNSGINTLSGGAGNDLLEGLGDADLLDGGDGTDTATYLHATAGVFASLNTAFTPGAGVTQPDDATGDRYTNIENIQGSTFADTLIGDASINTLSGDGGDDVLEGYGGADVLDGGTGNNTASYAHSALIIGAGNVALGVTASLAAPGANTGDAYGDSYSNIDNLLGSDYNDTLTGSGVVNGVAVANTLTGGFGDDILEGLAGADVLIGGTGTDTASYGSAGTAILASLADSTTNTGTDAQGDSYSGIENLTGSVAADTLIGDHASNTLTGGAGDDVLEGLAGADVLIGGDGTNTVSFAHSGLAYGLAQQATSALNSGVTASLTTIFLQGGSVSQTGDAQGDSYSGIANMLGSGFADTLIGDAAANAINGGAGDDVLEGMGGADALDGGDTVAGNNTASYQHAAAQAGGVGVLASLDAAYRSSVVSVAGDAAGDSYTNISNLSGSLYNDTLIGDINNNTLSGGDGDDVLEGLGGADHLVGGAGNNTASYSRSTASGGTLASLLTPGSNSGDAQGDTYDNIQNLTGSAYADTLTGDTASNILDGGAGNDLLDGGAGLNGDSFIGGTGTQDTVTYANALSAGVIATLTSASNITAGPSVIETGDATGDTFKEVENLIGSAFDDTLIGDVQDNILTGGTGNDILEGMAGADQLIGGAVGGADTDTASYAHATTTVVASLTAVASLTIGGPVVIAGDAVGDVYTSIENLSGGSSGDTLIGDIGINTLSGSAGNDVLEGMGGTSDLLDGGDGSDTATYVHAGIGVVASLTQSADFTAGLPVTASGDAAGDSYVSVENLHGSTFADTLIGDGSNNTLWGDSGDDILEGYGGADALYGGDNSDTASYAHATGPVSASLTAGLLTSGGDAAGDTYDSIENLTGSSFNDTLIGNSSVNVLSGGGGDDTLEGIGGGDSYDGGSGSNTVSYAHAADAGGGAGVTASLLTPGSNLGAALGDSYTLIQNLTGSDYNDILVGDANANILSGGLGIDNLSGGAGDDSLYGGDGNDILSGGLGTDTLYGNVGNDSLTDDGVGAAKLYGGDGADTFTITGADASADTIDGGDKSALRLAGGWSNALAGDTIVWSPTGAGTAITVNMTTRTMTGNINFANVENFTLAIPGSGTSSIIVTLDNYSNIIDASAGTAVNDQALYGTALGSISADLRITNGINVTGGSSVLDNYDATTRTWTGTGDTLKGIEYIYSASQYADNLYGSDGVNNWLAGAQGADYINGGSGTDTVYLDPGRGATVVASLLTAAQNAQMGIVMADTAQGDTYVNIENLYANGATDQLYGNAGINVLSSNGIMEGFAGADTLTSLNGANATASYAHAGDTYLAGQGITTAAGQGVTANLTSPTGTAFASGWSGAAALAAGLGSAVTNTGDALGDTYTGNIYKLTGSAFDDILIGNALANTITSGAGNDLMEGLAGADAFDGGAGIDTVSYAHSTLGVVADLGTSGTYVPSNDAVGDTFTNVENLIGTIYNDTLVGNSLDNVLNGGLGNDLLDGSFGFNTASYAFSSGAVTVSLANPGSQQDTVGAGKDTLVNIQALIGSDYNDTLTGDGGNNTIDGGLGADTLNGGAGTDTLAYSSATGGVTVLLNGANSQNDVLSGFENLLGSLYGDVLTGDALDNVIEGDLGNDTLDGGANTATGDTVSYALASRGVTVSLANTGAQNTVGAGTDTLSNFENLTGSAYDDTLTGNSDSNTISGGAGDDLLIASLGGDVLAGGLGTDTVSYQFSGAVTVTINAMAVHDSVTDTLSGIENVIGSANNDTLTGDAGNNLIDGGQGDDTISGGGGSDTVSYAAAPGSVSVDLSAAGVNAYGGTYGNDTLTLIQNVIGTAFNDTLTGDGNANVFEGGAGDDVMDGLGSSNDTASYSTASAGVAVSLAISGAQDTLGAGHDTLSNFENLTGSAYDDTLTGSAVANTLDGGAGNDILIGGAGNDILIGGTGSDTVSYAGSALGVTANLSLATAQVSAGDASGDTYSGIENVIGSSNNDSLTGSTGNNVMTGGAGNDTLTGSGGNDVFYANEGHDTVAASGNYNDTFYVSALTANLPTVINGGGRDAGSVANHGGNVMVLQDLVDHGSYNMTDMASLNTRLVNIDTLNISDSKATALTILSSDIRNMVDNGNASQLFVEANTGDTLTISLAAGESVAQSSVTSAANGSTYTDYTVFDATMTQVAQVHWHAA